MKVYRDIFRKIISLENLFQAWADFRSDKQKKVDVCKFELRLEQNIFGLHRELKNRNYKHGAYSSFYIQDPKQRHIHKAKVRDRVLHHAVFSVLNPIFEPTFIANSFSCQIGKGTHKGVFVLNKMIRKASKNHSMPCFILKCDIKKFFDSVDHETLLQILNRRVKDPGAQWLMEEIIGSFRSNRSDLFNCRGLPIGNLTSQLFANVYMNEFDQFVRNELRIRYYARYTDDFVIISSNPDYLRKIVIPISKFLKERLALELHPKKIFLRKSRQGADFLGYVILPHYSLIRTKTRRRIFKKLRQRVNEYREGKITIQSLGQCLQSYLGVLSHANSHKIRQELLNQYWFWLNE